MTPSFAPTDPAALPFYAEHGYVVLTPQLAADDRDDLRRELDALWATYAAEHGLPVDEYLANISQWRDLWRGGGAFHRALTGPRLWQVAAQFMGLGGARLLHDHVIAKPAGDSGEVPWHQDYPYWPVDTDEGLSCWCPLADVGADGGCLEVLDGSHRWGESPPADFLADDRSAFDARPDRVRLPAAAGSVVVLDSLTWHRSGPNRDAGLRPVYITLWLPPDARYAPAHAAWHPVNEHVTAAPGQILNDDWFPCFGDRHIRGDGPRPLAHTGPAPRDGLSMFDASRTIARQLRVIVSRGGVDGVDTKGGLDRLLASADAVSAIVRESVAAGVAAPGSEDALRAALDRLRIASEAYRLHRARNVYNGAYVGWWRLAGAAWDARLQAGAERLQAGPERLQAGPERLQAGDERLRDRASES